MKKLCFVIFIILLFGANCFAEDTGIWKLKYYVDEFKLSTDKAYITTSTPIPGTFCNSVVDDAQLNVSILIDEDNLAFILYEYGDNRVKNSFSRQRVYDITMLDDARQKTYFTGYMEKSGGDRIIFKINDSKDIIEELLENSSLSFYIAEQENPTTNYLFSIVDTEGLDDMFSAMKNIQNETEYQKAISQYETGNYLEAMSLFEKLGEYKDSAEWRTKINAVMFEEYKSLQPESITTSAFDLKPAGLAIVYKTSKGTWYHVTVNCSAMSGGEAYTLEDCATHCKNCKKCEAPDPELVNELCLWRDEEGKYHTSDACSDFVGTYKLIPLANAPFENEQYCEMCGVIEYLNFNKE